VFLEGWGRNFREELRFSGNFGELKRHGKKRLKDVFFARTRAIDTRSIQ